ncbi:hypothetical protein [Streptomyces sp. IMTB 2501]|nr:hypothetical protein [Streptomyces sp. IMTB 2501]
MLSGLPEGGGSFLVRDLTVRVRRRSERKRLLDKVTAGLALAACR